MGQWLAALTATVMVFFSGFFGSGQTVSVTRIIDGDTVEIEDGRHIRYIGIDSPEKSDCYATAAAKLNEQLVLGKKIRLELGPKELDTYGRTLAFVWQGDELVNQKLLEKGAGEFFLDTVNVNHQDPLIQAANSAHDQRIGLWSACGDDCSIKGNLDKLDKRYYHLPEFRHYDQVIVNLDEGDRWFCSESQAQAAGFERARE